VVELGLGADEEDMFERWAAVRSLRLIAGG
jgi:hypothetical protein